MGVILRQGEETMNLKATWAGLMMVAVAGTAVLPAMPAAAQSSHHRQQTKNTWRNVAIGSGALGVYGLLSHNSTAAILGGAGALYSASRYEHDRKSQSHMDHERAAMYSRHSFTRNGHRYVRRTVHKHGQTYYQFVRR
jgi:hypothetical protein